tara:strand:+ start:1282 stop:1455 length:174 start_codon:yes stop_codon:yes gene_type:complete
MTDQELILFLTRKNAELESLKESYKKDAQKYADYWLASTKEVTELKLKLEGGASNGK